LENNQIFDNSFVIYLMFAILLALFVAVASYILSYKFLNKPPSPSPYTKMPLRYASDIFFESKEHVLRFLFVRHEYHNQMFDLNKAAFCRETGRIFPDAVTWYKAINVDWTFLNKRYPGHYVSWGSLSDYQKEIIRSAHHSLEGFQTEVSSPEPAPSKIEPFYADTIPGPLYVDLDTKILLGWQCVPDTDLEVLIVQKPKGIFELPNNIK
jgi:hypothetical protein